MKCFEKRWRYSTGVRTNGRWITNRLYSIWKGMRSRCTNSKNKAYKNYGGRGITVCDEWLSYDNFYEWAMANGYDESLTIDRADNDENYEPSNCRWVPMECQLRNKRSTVRVGEKCLSEVARDMGVDVHCLQYRHSKGLPLNAPVKDRTKRLCGGRTLKEISDETGLRLCTLIYRWNKGIRNYEDLTAEVKRGVVR
ncbi:hypothetical protein C3V36_11205 [Lachnospiraceae bacterium oral taxon 500]|nr:hypothetical protein C3V36_11205 [Lachnospiraceae bacterium oral taxon 500]